MPDANVKETPSEPDGNVRAWIRLRNEPFNLRCHILGATTEEAKADLIGVNYRTLRSARLGGVGEKFVASTLAAFQRHAAVFADMNLDVTFEALFATADVGAGLPS